jgi:hypothetical protein
MMSKYVVRLETKISLPLLRNDLFDFHLPLKKLLRLAGNSIAASNF